MIVEFIGSTGAGKTTLASDILYACRERGIDASMDDDFVLKQVRLNWVKNNFSRRRLVDLLSLLTCLVAGRNHLEFYVFAIRISLRSPGSWFDKLNLARNVLRKIGIHEIIHHRGSEQQVILVDNEGVLQAAHNLFVCVSVQVNASDLSTFARLVPLPDVVVYVRQPESVLIERTMIRGHKRIPNRSYANVERFIKRAVDVFDRLVQQSVLEDRLVAVDGQQDVFVAQEHQNNPLLPRALHIIRAGMEAVTADHPTGMRFSQDSNIARPRQIYYGEE